MLYEGKYSDLSHTPGFNILNVSFPPRPQQNGTIDNSTEIAKKELKQRYVDAAGDGKFSKPCYIPSRCCTRDSFPKFKKIANSNTWVS